MTPMQLSFAASTDEDNAEGSNETITVYKLTDSTTPCSIKWYNSLQNLP